MFYSHEVLTSRKYGVATVWLVATLGSKSTLKKVNRKAILEVNVPKACETIMTPEAPMALRLQSNLLYGVSRVYSQQCGYVLADAQTAQNNIRALLRVIRATEVDVEVSRARPDQLLLQDDPAFLPDLAFTHNLDFDFSNLEASIAPGASQRSSTLSPGTLRATPTALSPAGALIIPSSEIGDTGDLGGFVIPGDEGRGSDGGALARQREEDVGFLPEADFGFDAEGNLVELGPPVWAAQGAAPTARMVGRESEAASARVRREHEEGARAGVELGDRMDIDLPAGDDYTLLPEAEPFPAGLATTSPFTPLPVDEAAAGMAPQRRVPRVPRVPRPLPLDATISLRNTDLSRWNTDYLANMAAATQQRLPARAAVAARRNAEFWVLGSGIGGVGAGIGAAGLAAPLADTFSGAGLLTALTGAPAPDAGRKRGAEGAEEGERRARRRRSDDEREVARGLEEDGLGLTLDDVEVPREAPEGLGDDTLSSAMPWNVTASVRGSSVARGAAAAGFPTSAGGPASVGGLQPGSLGRRASRLVSASPLLGRGRASGLGELAGAGAEALTSEGVEEAGLALGLGAEEEGLAPEEAFELYGPAAGVDTQTAAQSQWVRDALDQESDNFLLFVESAVEERRARAGEEGLGEGGESEEVAFEELLPPERNSSIVAAQALLHVLSLGTKSLLRVRQGVAYGPIGLRVVRTGA